MPPAFLEDDWNLPKSKDTENSRVDKVSFMLTEVPLFSRVCPRTLRVLSLTCDIVTYLVL